jgi:hypothetical protein
MPVLDDPMPVLDDPMPTLDTSPFKSSKSFNEA